MTKKPRTSATALRKYVNEQLVELGEILTSAHYATKRKHEVILEWHSKMVAAMEGTIPREGSDDDKEGDDVLRVPSEDGTGEAIL